VAINIAVDIYSIAGRIRIEGMGLAILSIDCVCLIYILRSKLLGAVFKDFSEPEPEAEPVKKKPVIRSQNAEE
jgi:hypothetical protein